MIHMKLDFQGELLLAVNGMEHKAVHLTSSSPHSLLLFLTLIFAFALSVL